MKDRCGFLFVRYKRHYCTELVSWEHAACLLSGIKKRPLVGGWLNTTSVVISIGATASVRCREVVHSWEGPFHCIFVKTQAKSTWSFTSDDDLPLVPGRESYMLYDLLGDWRSWDVTGLVCMLRAVKAASTFCFLDCKWIIIVILPHISHKPMAVWTWGLRLL